MQNLKLNSTSSPVIKGLKQKGLTLMELIVALAIATIVISAVLINVASVGKTSVVQSTQSNMMENGQFALDILSNNIRNAGYSELSEVPSPIVDRSDRFGDYLFGCANGKMSVTGSTTVNSWKADCSGRGNGVAETIAVRYQGGQLIEAPPLSGSGSMATSLGALDCASRKIIEDDPIYDGKGNLVDYNEKGNTIVINGERVLIVDNRFFIEDNGLWCAGNGGDAGVPIKLVDNIEHMQFLFGVSELVKDSAGFETLSGETNRYMTAAQLQSTSPTGNKMKAWERVSAVRICLIVRSATPVSPESNSFINCEGVRVTPTDGFMRKAMLTTVEVANMGSGL